MLCQTASLKGKAESILMKVIDGTGAGGILSRLAFLAVCCLSCYIAARLLNIIQHQP